MIEEYIRLVTFTTAIYMQEDGTAIRITLAVFLIERIYFSQRWRRRATWFRGIGAPIQVSRLLLLRY